MQACLIHSSCPSPSLHGFLIFLQVCVGLHQPDGWAGCSQVLLPHISFFLSPRSLGSPLYSCITSLVRGTLVYQSTRGPEAVTAPGCVRPTPLMMPFEHSDFLTWLWLTCRSLQLTQVHSHQPFLMGNFVENPAGGSRWSCLQGDRPGLSRAEG